MEEENAARRESKRMSMGMQGGGSMTTQDYSAFFASEMEQDGEVVEDARSLWKKAVQGGGGNEIYKAIAAMNALSEVGLHRLFSLP